MTSDLVDRFRRQHSDLRVSLTDRCSLRCTYCMPEFGMTWLRAADTLTVSELLEIVTVFVELGIRTVRLTGGEPLLRPDLAEIVGRFSSLTTPDGDSIHVAMTTNAIGLEKVIDDLVESGLSRLNISLDTLRPDRFFELTKRDRWDDVIRGISAAHEANLRPLKLNAVAMRGVNEDELVDLVRFSETVDAEVRFIEHMPLDRAHTWSRENLLTRDEIIDILSQEMVLSPVGERGPNPAERWYVDGGPRTVGVIASVTAAFCGSCDRLRLTSDGQMRTCLFSQEEGDLRTLVRAGASRAELREAVRAHVLTKRAGNGIGEPDFVQPVRGMNAIGG